jgi:hypothetical protein
MTADQFYYEKFLEWQQKGNGDYRVYVRRAGRLRIKADLLLNKEEFEREVCSYLKTYAKGQERQSILSVIQGIANPERDILEIIVGATLDACGYPDIGNALVGLAIVGIIAAALIALLGSIK